MNRPTQWLLVARLLCELLRYDVAMTVAGFGSVHRRLSRTSGDGRTSPANIEESICDAAAIAISLYVKPVRCLQRSVAMTHTLRRYGVSAELVMACRAVPFFGHAWVEVDGHVVNDSPVYRQNLHAIERV